MFLYIPIYFLFGLSFGFGDLLDPQHTDPNSIVIDSRQPQLRQSLSQQNQNKNDNVIDPFAIFSSSSGIGLKENLSQSQKDQINGNLNKEQESQRMPVQVQAELVNSNSNLDINQNQAHPQHHSLDSFPRENYSKDGELLQNPDQNLIPNIFKTPSLSDHDQTDTGREEKKELSPPISIFKNNGEPALPNQNDKPLPLPPSRSQSAIPASSVETKPIKNDLSEIKEPTQSTIKPGSNNEGLMVQQGKQPTNPNIENELQKATRRIESKHLPTLLQSNSVNPHTSDMVQKAKPSLGTGEKQVLTIFQSEPNMTLRKDNLNTLSTQNGKEAPQDLNSVNSKANNNLKNSKPALEIGEEQVPTIFQSKPSMTLGKDNIMPSSDKDGKEVHNSVNPMENNVPQNPKSALEIGEKQIPTIFQSKPSVNLVNPDNNHILQTPRPAIGVAGNQMPTIFQSKSNTTLGKDNSIPSSVENYVPQNPQSNLGIGENQLPTIFQSKQVMSPGKDNIMSLPNGDGKDAGNNLNSVNPIQQGLIPNEQSHNISASSNKQETIQSSDLHIVRNAPVKNDQYLNSAQNGFANLPQANGQVSGVNAHLRSEIDIVKTGPQQSSSNGQQRDHQRQNIFNQNHQQDLQILAPQSTDLQSKLTDVNGMIHQPDVSISKERNLPSNLKNVGLQPHHGDLSSLLKTNQENGPIQTSPRPVLLNSNQQQHIDNNNNMNQGGIQLGGMQKSLMTYETTTEFYGPNTSDQLYPGDKEESQIAESKQNNVRIQAQSIWNHVNGAGQDGLEKNGAGASHQEDLKNMAYNSKNLDDNHGEDSSSIGNNRYNYDDDDDEEDVHQVDGIGGTNAVGGGQYNGNLIGEKGEDDDENIRDYINHVKKEDHYANNNIMRHDDDGQTGRYLNDEGKGENVKYGKVQLQRNSNEDVFKHVDNNDVDQNDYSYDDDDDAFKSGEKDDEKNYNGVVGDNKGNVHKGVEPGVDEDDTNTDYSVTEAPPYEESTAADNIGFKDADNVNDIEEGEDEEDWYHNPDKAVNNRNELAELDNNNNHNFGDFEDDEDNNLYDDDDDDDDDNNAHNNAIADNDRDEDMKDFLSRYGSRDKDTDGDNDDNDMFADRHNEEYYRGRFPAEDLLDEMQDEIKKTKPPTAPTNMVLFYTWMILAILIMVIVVSTYQAKCKGLLSNGNRQQARGGEDRKRLLDSEFV